MALRHPILKPTEFGHDAPAHMSILQTERKITSDREEVSESFAIPFVGVL